MRDERPAAPEQTLSQKLSDLELLFQSVSIGISHFDTNLRYVRINPALAAINGRPVAEHIGKTLSEVVPDLAPLVEPSLRAVLTSGQPIRDKEIRGRVPADSEVERTWISNYYPLLSGQGIRGIACVVQEITELRRAELARREAETLYRTLVETMNDGLGIQDASGTITYVNGGLCRIFGRPAEEIIGRRITDFLDEDNLRIFAEQMKERKQGRTTSYEMSFMRPDGAQVATIVAPARIVEPIGRVTTGSFAVMTDITEHKRIVEELVRRTAELERSNRELEQFAYVASHDLQEPLRMVASYTQLLQKRYRGQLDQEAEDFIGFAVDGANRMQRLIADLLMYSRAGAPGTPLERVDAHEALDGAVANLRMIIEESGARVTRDELADVLADERQLVQVFQNLIGNAIKFHGEAPPRVHVSAARQEERVVFSVADNGAGIAPEFFPRLFQIFHRLHGREVPGTGIGLALCKRIVERHGGQIWLDSTPGQGSTFRFSLPSAPAPGGSLGSRGGGSPRGQSGE